MSFGNQFNFKNMKTIKKIGATRYEVTETREDKHIIDIKAIDGNIKMMDEKIDSKKKEIKNIEKQKAEQKSLKEKLLKIK